MQSVSTLLRDATCIAEHSMMQTFHQLVPEMASAGQALLLSITSFCAYAATPMESADAKISGVLMMHAASCVAHLATCVVWLLASILRTGHLAGHVTACILSAKLQLCCLNPSSQ